MPVDVARVLQGVGRLLIVELQLRQKVQALRDGQL